MILKQSTAVDVLIGPFVDSTNGYDAETGISPAVKLSKNGQTLAAKNDVTTPLHDADGYYNCELDATDTNTVGTLTLTVIGSATSLPVRHEFQVVEEAVYDAMYAASAAGPLQSTVAARTLDVTATGAAGIDWGNVENPTTVVDLSATDIQLCDTITTYTGNTPQTADHTAGIADIPTVAEFNARTLASASYFDPAADTVATVTTVTNQLTAANIVDEWETQSQTDPTGFHVNVLEVGGTAQTANDNGADINAILVDTSTTLETHLTDVKGATFSGATDSLEAIRNRGDSAWTTGAGGTPPHLLQTTTIATLASQTSFTLTAGSADDDAYNGGIVVVTDQSTSTQKAVGTVSDYTGATLTVTLSADPGIFVMAVGDTIDIMSALGSAGSAPTAAQIVDEWETQSQLDPTGFHVNVLEIGGTAQTANDNGADINAILVDTNELQADWTNTGRLDTILDELTTQGDTNEGKIDTIDTNVDSVLADTGTTGVVIAAAQTVATVTDVTNAVTANVTSISGSSEAADNLEASAETIVIGAAEAGTLSTTQMTSDLTEATDDHYIGRIIIWTSGVLQDQATDITDYAGATGLLTYTAVTEAPTATDTFIIV